MTLDELLLTSAQRFPDCRAVTFPKCTLTYLRLQAWVESLSNAFGSLGVGKGDTVCILLRNSPDYIACYFAAARLGAAAVPLNTFLKPEELKVLIEDSRCALLVTSSEFQEAADAVRESVENTVLTDSDDRYVPHSAASDMPSGEAPAAGIGEDDPATIIYTSGTTGRPKGVVLTHRNITANIESCREIFPASSEDRFLVFLPLFHSFTLTVSTILPLSLGARVVLCESARPFGRLLKRIATERVTIMAAVPAFYRALTKTRFPGLSLLMKSVRFFISGSAPLPEKIIEAFEKRFSAPLIEGYGLSEASPCVSVNPVDGVRKAGSVGLPIPRVEIKIVGEQGESVPAGDVGEIAVSGPNVMGGYLRMPEETAKVLKDEWLFTGDMGYLDDDGYLFISDRKKDLILHRGMNVYPREIEFVLEKHPAIAEAAVVGRPHPSHGEVPEAYVILEGKASLSPQEVKDHCSKSLADFKVPRTVHFVDDVPRTATGKIAKRKLVEECES
jgi:long-chain acyl-CoA synthetase